MENKKPKVSIGMPVWNGEEFIRLSLNSLLAQEFKDFELIISDNASTDNTKKIINEFKDKRIKYFLQKTNIGSDGNFNFVLDKAQGEYFMLAAYDDLWDKEFISEMVKVLDEDEVVLSFCDMSEMDKDGNLIQPYPKQTDDIFLQGTIFERALTFLTKNISTYCIYGLMRTDVIKKIGFNPEKRIQKSTLNRGTYSSDVLTVFRLMFDGKFKKVNKLLFYHRYLKKYTDLRLKSKSKKDVLNFLISIPLKMYSGSHEYHSSLRRLIFKSNLKLYQKYFLFFVILMVEIKSFLIRGFSYFISFFKLIFLKDYREDYYKNASKYA